MRKNILTAAILLLAAVLLAKEPSEAQTKSLASAKSKAENTANATFKPSGRYKIITILPDTLLSGKVNSGDKFYLYKQTWGDNTSVVVDSAVVSKRNSITFIGGIYQLPGGKKKFFYTRLLQYNQSRRQ